MRAIIVTAMANMIPVGSVFTILVSLMVTEVTPAGGSLCVQVS